MAKKIVTEVVRISLKEIMLSLQKDGFPVSKTQVSRTILDQVGLAHIVLDNTCHLEFSTVIESPIVLLLKESN